MQIGQNKITLEDVEKQGKDTEASNEVDEKIPVRTIIIKNTPEEFSRFGVKNVPKEFLTHLKEQQRNSKSILSGNTGGHAHNHEHEHNHNHSHEEEERQEKSNDLSNDYDYFEPDSYVTNNGVGSGSVFFDPRSNINSEYSQDGVGSAGGETDQVSAAYESANRDALSQEQELPSPGQSNYYTEQDNTLAFKKENNIAPPFAFADNTVETNDVIDNYAVNNVIRSGNSIDISGPAKVNNIDAATYGSPSGNNANSAVESYSKPTNIPNSNTLSLPNSQAVPSYSAPTASFSSNGAQPTSAPVVSNYNNPVQSNTGSSLQDYSSPVSAPIGSSAPTSSEYSSPVSAPIGSSAPTSSEYSSPVANPIGQKNIQASPIGQNNIQASPIGQNNIQASPIGQSYNQPTKSNIESIAASPIGQYYSQPANSNTGFAPAFPIGQSYNQPSNSNTGSIPSSSIGQTYSQPTNNNAGSIPASPVGQSYNQPANSIPSTDDYSSPAAPALTSGTFWGLLL